MFSNGYSIFCFQRFAIQQDQDDSPRRVSTPPKPKHSPSQQQQNRKTQEWGLCWAHQSQIFVRAFYKNIIREISLLFCQVSQTFYFHLKINQANNKALILLFPDICTKTKSTSSEKKSFRTFPILSICE